jgi:hypothetical protein
VLPLLSDKTWSVREEAAVTLGAMVRHFGAAGCPPVLTVAVAGLQAVRTQQDDFEKYSCLHLPRNCCDHLSHQGDDETITLFNSNILSQHPFQQSTPPHTPGTVRRTPRI